MESGKKEEMTGRGKGKGKGERGNNAGRKCLEANEGSPSMKKFCSAGRILTSTVGSRMIEFDNSEDSDFPLPHRSLYSLTVCVSRDWKGSISPLTTAHL